MNTKFRNPASIFSAVSFVFLLIITFSATICFCTSGLENNLSIPDSSLELIGLLMIACLSPVLVLPYFDNERRYSICLLMLSESTMLAVDLIYCSLEHSLSSTQIALLWSITLLSSSAVYYCATNYLRMVFIKEVKNNVRLRTVLNSGLAICAVICFLNPFVEIIGHMDNGVMDYNSWAFIIVVLDLIPAVISIKILKTYAKSEPLAILFWLFVVTVVTGMVIQIFDTSAYYTVVMTGYGFIFIFSAEFINRKYKLQENDVENQELEKLTLSSQLTPHFLFNSLSAIMNMPSNTERSREVLGDFSSFLRYSLDYSNKFKPVPVFQEIEQTESYVNVQKYELGSRLRFDYDLAAGGFRVPPFTLRSLVSQITVFCRENSTCEASIAVKTETKSGKHHLFFESVVKDTVANAAPAISLDSELMGILENRLNKMVGGRIALVSCEGDRLNILIEIPEVSNER